MILNKVVFIRVCAWLRANWKVTCVYHLSLSCISLHTLYHYIGSVDWFSRGCDFTINNTAPLVIYLVFISHFWQSRCFVTFKRLNWPATEISLTCTMYANKFMRIYNFNIYSSLYVYSSEAYASEVSLFGLFISLMNIFVSKRLIYSVIKRSFWWIFIPLELLPSCRPHDVRKRHAMSVLTVVCVLYAEWSCSDFS